MYLYIIYTILSPIDSSLYLLSIYYIYIYYIHYYHHYYYYYYRNQSYGKSCGGGSSGKDINPQEEYRYSKRRFGGESERTTLYYCICWG